MTLDSIRPTKTLAQVIDESIRNEPESWTVAGDYLSHNNGVQLYVSTSREWIWISGKDGAIHFTSEEQAVLLKSIREMNNNRTKAAQEKLYKKTMAKFGYQ